MSGNSSGPAGQVGFQATPEGSNLTCFFSKKNPRETYGYPTCYGRHPFRKERVTEVIVTSNAPLTYTFTTDKSSVFHMPALEPADIKFDHDFKFVLTQARWSKSLLRLDWQSDGRTAQTLELKRAANGMATLKVGTATLQFIQDTADKKVTIVDFVPDRVEVTAPVPATPSP